MIWKLQKREDPERENEHKLIRASIVENLKEGSIQTMMIIIRREE